ncbi:cytochrome P460 family protein [bacterium]|nr:cytochrome P460 family protein [bacterium]
MKKILIVCLGLATVLAFLIVYSGADEEMPSPNGEEFWTYITETNSYKMWDHWPGYPDMYPGQSPHGAYLKLYVNDIAHEAIQNGKETMPDGAIIIKENYGKDKESLMAITPMYKVKDYDPDAGNWFWAKYGAKGKIMASGKVEGCINCHKSKKENDWLFTEIK